MREIKKAQIIQILNEAQHEFLEANRRERIVNRPVINPETGEPVLDPRTGKPVKEKVSHMSFDPHRTYMPVEGDKGNQTLQNKLIELGKAKDGDEAKIMLYRMRQQVRNGVDPVQILQNYGLYDERLDFKDENKILLPAEERLEKTRNLFVRILTTPEEPKKVQPMTSKEFPLDKPTPPADKFIYSGTGKREDRFLHQPFTCEELAEWKRTHAEEYEKALRIFGPNIGFCKHREVPEKIETRGGYEYAGYSLGTPVWKKLMNRGMSRNEAKDYILQLRNLVDNGADLQQLMRERGLLGPKEQLPPMEYKEVMGLQQSEPKGKIITLAEKINRDLLKNLRNFFVDAPIDNQDVRIAEFKTKAAKKVALMLDNRSIPPILINTKFTDRLQAGSTQTNNSISIKGISTNFYPSAYAFIESVINKAQNTDTKNLSSFHQGRWANTISINWEEHRPGDVRFLGKSDRYQLNKTGYRPEDINVMLKTDWSITGERQDDNFVWTFKFIVKFGAKQEEDERFLYGLQKIKFKQGDEGKFMSVTHDENAPIYQGFEKRVEVPLNPDIQYDDNNPITENEEVMNGLSECIKLMIGEISTIDRFGAITLNDIPAQMDESYRITQRVIKEIKNNYYKPKAY